MQLVHNMCLEEELKAKRVRSGSHAGSDFDAYVAEVEAGLGPGGKDVLNAFRAHYTMASQLMELRKSRKLSQETVAELAGVHQSDISRLEHGAGYASKEKLDRIGAVFGLAVGFVPPTRKKLRAAV